MFRHTTEDTPSHHDKCSTSLQQMFSHHGTQMVSVSVRQMFCLAMINVQSRHVKCSVPQRQIFCIATECSISPWYTFCFNTTKVLFHRNKCSLSLRQMFYFAAPRQMLSHSGKCSLSQRHCSVSTKYAVSPR